MSATTIHWFRKGLRLHDNAALLEACKGSKELYPVFIIDPFFANPEQVGTIRYRFLLQSLTDLDTSLRRHGSQLFVVRGDPVEQFPVLFERLNVTKLTFESDTEPYARKRDAEVCRLAAEAGVSVVTMSGHTVRDPEAYVAKAKGKVPIAYQPFVKLFNSLGPLPEVLPTVDVSVLPPCGSAFSDDDMTVPTLEEMGYDDQGIPVLYPGGETAALERLQVHIARKQWIATFEKPKTSPNALEPATTVLSPYLKFGCLSPRLFYHKLQEVYQSVKNHSQPPVSLVGQLLWREFFYLCGYTTPNFDKMVGNPVCKQIPWQRDPEMLAAWKEARTGYPFIDAIMTQLRTEGWIHHLARHAVACFLTRGDLYQSWEEGVKVFDIYLIDGDWSLNNGNWLWLSASAFFYQFFRVYSPVAFGQKTDPDGAYIRKYLPQLRKFPKQFIYQPWKAPKSLQESCGCIVGRDYPLPIVKHEEVSKINTGKMKQAYDDNKAMAAGLLTSGLKGDFDGDDKEKGQTSATKRKNLTKPTKRKRSKAPDLLPGQQKLEF